MGNQRRSMYSKDQLKRDPDTIMIGEATDLEKQALSQAFQKPGPAMAAIQFALETDEGMSFLRCWNEGDFEAIRREWPEAPETVFIGADPLHPESGVIDED